MKSSWCFHPCHCATFNLLSGLVLLTSTQTANQVISWFRVGSCSSLHMHLCTAECVCELFPQLATVYSTRLADEEVSQHELCVLGGCSAAEALTDCCLKLETC